MVKKISTTFGKLSPPHIGHVGLGQQVIQYAKDNGMDHMIFTSRRHMKKLKNPRPYPDTPLSPEQKVKHIKRFLQTENVALEESPYSTIETLFNNGYHEVHIHLGSDRIEDGTGEKLKEKYGDRVKVIQFGEQRKEGEKGVRGASSTLVRKHAANNDFEQVRSMIPDHVSDEHAREYFDEVRAGLKQAQVELKEEVSVQTRIKLSRIAKRNAKIRAAKRRARKKRRRNIPQLKNRAKQEVKSNLRHKFSKRPWKKLGFASRVSVDRNVNRRKKIADTMVRRILPNVIRGENERLRKVSSTRKEEVELTLLTLLTEAQRGSRKVGSTKKGVNSASARVGARRRKAKQRLKAESKKKSGIVKGNYAVVKATSGKYAGRTMIVAKDSVNPKTMKEIIAPGNFNLAAGKKATTDSGFVNTDSSIELFGMVKGEGKAKTPKVKKPAEEKEKKEKKAKANKAQKTLQQKQNELPPLDLRIDDKWEMPKDMKSRAFKAEDYEWAFSGLAEIMVNGRNPKEMIKSGDITEEQYMRLADNRNLLQATLRAVQNSGFLGAKKGKYKFIHTGRGLEQKNSKLYRETGAVDPTPKPDVFIYDTEDPKASLGISFKSGAAQLGSSKEKETRAMATYAYEQVKNNLDKGCQKLIENLIDKGFKEMSESLKLPGGINVFKRDTGKLATKNPKVAKAVKDSIATNKKLEKDIESIFNDCKPFKKALLREAATGEGKFKDQYSETMLKEYGQKVNIGVATHVLAISDDAKTTSLVQMDDDFFDKIEPEVKMYVAAKTTDADITSEIKEYKDTKGLLIAAAGQENFKQFKSVVEKRVYEGYKRKGLKPPEFDDKELKDMMKDIAESGSLPNVFKFKLMQAKAALRFGIAGQKSQPIQESIVFKFMKNFINEEATVAISSDFEKNDGENSMYDQLLDLQDSGDLEEINSDEWLEMCKEYVNGDLMNFLQFMGIELNGFDTGDIDFADIFARKYSTKMNTIFINGRAKFIPVIEQYISEKRNYRKEYDNYHSRPEQRKNRSKRVLARRLMMKLGRVKKGDGKDVDHKDGNPKNNGKSNLRVRSKSSNRADND